MNFMVCSFIILCVWLFIWIMDYVYVIMYMYDIYETKRINRLYCQTYVNLHLLYIREKIREEAFCWIKYYAIKIANKKKNRPWHRPIHKCECEFSYCVIQSVFIPRQYISLGVTLKFPFVKIIFNILQKKNIIALLIIDLVWRSYVICKLVHNWSLSSQINF